MDGYCYRIVTVYLLYIDGRIDINILNRKLLKVFKYIIYEFIHTEQLLNSTNSTNTFLYDASPFVGNHFIYSSTSNLGVIVTAVAVTAVIVNKFQ